MVDATPIKSPQPGHAEDPLGQLWSRMSGWETADLISHLEDWVTTFGMWAETRSASYRDFLFSGSTLLPQLTFMEAERIVLGLACVAAARAVEISEDWEKLKGSSDVSPASRGDCEPAGLPDRGST